MSAGEILSREDTFQDAIRNSKFQADLYFARAARTVSRGREVSTRNSIPLIAYNNNNNNNIHVCYNDNNIRAGEIMPLKMKSLDTRKLSRNFAPRIIISYLTAYIYADVSSYAAPS